MTAMNQTTGAARIFMVLHGDVYEQFVLNGKMKISQRFRDRVAELIENEDLKNELRRFYRRHSDFFSNEVGENRSIELYAPKHFYGILYQLSFFVFDHGNVSLISRVLMYHYAVKHQWLPKPPANEKKPISRPVCSERVKVNPIGPLPDRRSDRRRQAYSVDTLFTGHTDTKRDMDALSGALQLGQSALVRYLIEQSSVAGTPEKIREFFTKSKKVEKQTPEIVRVRYRNTPKLDKVLDCLSLKIVGEDNRSLTLRIIVAFFAIQHGIRRR